jgi:LEA14-like dessication related protein
MKARVVVALLVLGACATLKNALVFQKPDILLKQINVTGLGLSGGTLDLIFDVFNPNDYRLRSTRLEVGLDLEGVHFGDALLERPLDLSPVNHSEVIVPLRFEWAGVSAGARALLSRQAVKFGLNGAVLVETPLGERRVGLQTSGDVPLRKFF